MKQSQLFIAVFLLAAMVFVITFAMQYLGGNNPPKHGDGDPSPRAELVFIEKKLPTEMEKKQELDEFSVIEREDKSHGFLDYWFHNPTKATIKLGVLGKNCQCSAVEVYLLPDGDQQLAVMAASFKGLESLGALHAITYLHTALLTCAEKVQGKDVQNAYEAVDVAPGAIGWVRLKFRGEKAGRKSLVARMWMNDRETGGRTDLELRLLFHEAVRVNPVLLIGTLTDAELSATVTRDIVCWSSTRKNLNLEVALAPTRSNRASDPVTIGQPIPLTADEVRKLEKELNPRPLKPSDASTSGPVLCAYRIPITLSPIAPDKTPFDVGPFRRRVLITCADTKAEPTAVVVLGQIRGLLDLGTEDEAGQLNFGSFRRSQGKTQSMPLHTEAEGLTLEFDRQRTPEYLEATLIPGKSVSSESKPKSWSLRVQVLPNKASGFFPRKDDPIYEDSAVYLNAKLPGKPTRSIRIAVQGTAGEG